MIFNRCVSLRPDKVVAVVNKDKCNFGKERRAKNKHIPYDRHRNNYSPV